MAALENTLLPGYSANVSLLTLEEILTRWLGKRDSKVQVRGLD